MNVSSALIFIILIINSMKVDLSAAVARSINQELDKLVFKQNVKGKIVLKPNVCCACDRHVEYNKVEFIKEKILKRSWKTTLSSVRDDVPVALLDSYKYKGLGTKKWMENALLSPRSCYDLQKRQFLCCRSCKFAMTHGEVGFHSISNHLIGSAPMCLLDLTDIELAFISPVRTHGHLFMYRAGRSRKIRGFHSFMKLDVQKVYNSMRLIDALMNIDNIAVVLSGPFTKAQVERKKTSCNVRLDKVLLALEWLRNNNRYYADLTKEDLETLKVPKIEFVNDYTIEESEDEAIETTDEFRVVFPDGVMNQQNGGQETIAEFKKVIQELKEGGSNIQVFSKSLDEIAPDYKDDNLVMAFPKMFPYGYGGPHDTRYRNDKDGDLEECTGNIDLEKYIEHVSSLSNPVFHEPLFCLVMFNIHMKQRMVRTAMWKGRKDKELLSAIATMNGESFSKASEGSPNGHGLSNSMKQVVDFYGLVEAISKYLPHTNRAASAARSNLEALCHKFGQMSFFLTVTPDEENGIEIQVYSGRDIDISEEKPLSQYTAEELKEMSVFRTKLSYDYPGLASFYFTQVLDIVIEKVIGWNRSKGCANEYGGICGIPNAYVATIEEQGRTRLHMHCGIWVQETQEMMNSLFNGKTEREVEVAKENIAMTMDKIGSTEITGEMTDKGVRKKVTENGTPERTNRMTSTCNYNITGTSTTAYQRTRNYCTTHCHCLETVPDQQLRDMRHKEGSQQIAGHIATCSQCGDEYSTNEIAIKHLEEKYSANLSIGSLCADPNKIEINDSRFTTDKMNAAIIRTRKDALIHGRTTFVTDIVNYARNTHKAIHHESCFKYDDECRYNLCKLPSSETCIEPVEKEMEWFDWNGDAVIRKIYEIREKRSKLDLFANTYCRAISLSHLHCNSNIRVLMPGPAAMYTTKYLTKDTQTEDQSPFDKMNKYMQNRLSEVRKITEESEGLSRIIAASFVHNSDNVIGASLAKYLTLEHTRFHFSHDFAFINALDIFKVIEKKPVQTIMRRRNDKTFPENYAYHYLYRPEELKDVCPKTFFEEYEVINKPPEKKMENDHHDYIEFVNDEHPGKQYQVIRRRTDAVTAKIRTYDFPDSKTFNGNILDPSTVITEDTEEYAKWTLLHFSCFTDDICSIQHEGSFTKKLRQIADKPELFEPDAFQILQNIQEVRNNYRVPRYRDELTLKTVKFVGDGTNNSKEENDDDSETQKERAAVFARLLFESLNAEKDLPEATAGKDPKSLTLDHLASKSGKENTDKNLCPIQVEDDTWWSHFVEVDVAEDSSNKTKSTPSKKQPEIKVTREQLVTLLGRRVRRRVMSGKQVDDITATGSARSIYEWSERPRQAIDETTAPILDKDQKRAFQVIVAQFVMTYYRDAEFNFIKRTGRQEYLNNRKNLEKMINGKRQLLMFFSGAGGSGKTAVINQVMMYASEFCRNLGVPFDRYTIRVTAVTGVAASSINGETLASASHIMKSINNLTEEHRREWAETRLLIIDEISFLSVTELANLNRVLKKLRENFVDMYGGLNIVFCGDFRQLEPLGRGQLPIYQATASEKQLFHEAINCFLELKGLHRFKNDERWGQVLMRFREGCPTQSDIALVNSRVVTENVILPPNLRYGTYFNKMRDTINTGLFRNHLKEHATPSTAPNSHLVILSDKLTYKFGADSHYVPFPYESEFWTHVGESDCQCGQSDGRFDPMLKLYYECEVMAVKNKLEAGIANGSQLLVDKIVLNAGMKPFQIVIDGVLCNAVRASAVKHIICKTKAKEAENVKRFYISPEDKTFKAKFPIPDKFGQHGFKARKAGKLENEREQLKHVRAVQVPLVVNNATTGFKLQGATVDNIFIMENAEGKKNWIYVLLSRVKTLNGLFLRKPIPTNPDHYMVPPALAAMLRDLNERCACPPFDEEDLDDFRDCNE